LRGDVARVDLELRRRLAGAIAGQVGDGYGAGSTAAATAGRGSAEGHGDLLASFPLELLRAAARLRADDLVALLVLEVVWLVGRREAVGLAVAKVQVDVALPLRERARARLALLRLAVLADFARGLGRVGVRRH